MRCLSVVLGCFGTRLGVSGLTQHGLWRHKPPIVFCQPRNSTGRLASPCRHVQVNARTCNKVLVAPPFTRNRLKVPAVSEGGPGLVVFHVAPCRVRLER